LALALIADSKEDEAEGAHMATRLILRALTGKLRGQQFTFTAPGQFILGRSSDCAVRLVDASVSRRHCLIFLDDQGAWAVDLGSLNGTLVTGQQVGRWSPGRGDDSTIRETCRHPLHDGDELRVCNNIFAVVLSEVATPSPEAEACADAALPGRAR
jgi:predicted component of type VI protein secretion system